MSGKRLRTWTCPYCDGTVLAPEILATHIRHEHSDQEAPSPTPREALAAAYASVTENDDQAWKKDPLMQERWLIDATDILAALSPEWRLVKADSDTAGALVAALAIIEDLMGVMDWIGTGPRESGLMEEAEYRSRIDALAPAAREAAERLRRKALIEAAEGARLVAAGIWTP